MEDRGDVKGSSLQRPHAFDLIISNTIFKLIDNYIYCLLPRSNDIESKKKGKLGNTGLPTGVLI